MFSQKFRFHFNVSRTDSLVGETIQIHFNDIFGQERLKRKKRFYISKRLYSEKYFN